LRFTPELYHREPGGHREGKKSNSLRTSMLSVDTAIRGLRNLPNRFLRIFSLAGRTRIGL
jgi:hypothetical protein